MATYYNTITLQDQGGAYPLLASRTMEHGDTIYITVNTGFSATVNTFTETGSAVPALGHSHANGSQVSWTIPNSGYSNGDVINISFFASNGTPYWQHVTDYRGYVSITISVVASCAGNPSSITSVTPDIYGESQQTQATTSRVYASWGTNCTAQIYVVQGGWNSGWLNGVYFTPTRGNTYTYYARSAGFSGSTAGVSAYTPYLPTDLSIGNGGNLTTSDGTWTQTLSSVGSPTNYNNYALADSSSNTANQYSKANGSSLSSGVGNHSIVNDNANNSPPGQTRTFYIWGSRTSTSGGNGGQGWSSGGYVTGGWEYTGSYFTVTRAATNTESVQSTSAGDAHDSQTGPYHNTGMSPTGQGTIHRVRLAGIQEGKHYDFRDSSTGTGTPIQGHVFLNSDQSAWENVDWPQLRASGSSQTNFSRRVWDQTVTVPSDTGSTTKTYYLWRADDSSGTNATYTGASYTRTIVNYDRYGGTEDRTLSGTATSYTLTITNALADMTYYVKSGSYTGSILASGSPSSDGNLVLTITPDSIPNVGDSTTNYLTVQGEHNAFPDADYSSGKSWTITRAGTSGGSGSGTSGTNIWGMKIRNAAGNVIYDTESRMGRFVTSGTAPSSGTLSQNQSATISVTGMLNTSDWQVIALPVTGASSSAYYGYSFTVTKASGQFTITNTSTIANSYKYYVVKSGG